MATLDTSYGWVAGDVERILLALDLGIGGYTISEMTVCCNKLGETSSTLVGRVRELLGEYDDAIEVQKGLGVSEDAGRTLIKADVLEWEVDKGGRFEAIMREKGRINDELLKIFAFCPLAFGGSSRNSTSLIRS